MDEEIRCHDRKHRHAIEIKSTLFALAEDVIAKTEIASEM